MSTSSDTSVAGPRTVRLPPSISVSDCAALKQQLLALVKSSDTVLIDVTDVALIDTAALQLVYAFSRERSGNGLSTNWQGHSPTFRNAATALGLRLGDDAGLCSNSASDHDS
jgi:phospholipid transport system transporter-binding protein